MLAMLELISQVKLRWLSANEGGRKGLPQGPIYYANARFAGDPEHQIFSIGLILPIGKPENAELRILVPENLPEVAARIVPGAKLHLTEGIKTVADCDIRLVELEER